MTPAITLLEQTRAEFRIRHYDAGSEMRHFGEHAAAELGQDPDRVFKTLISIVDANLRKPVVALVAVSDQLDLKRLAAASGGRKAVMADPQQAQRCTGYVVGGISPLAQKQRNATFIDQKALEFDSVFVSGGKRGLQIELSPTTLIELLDAHCCQLAK